MNNSPAGVGTKAAVPETPAMRYRTGSRSAALRSRLSRLLGRLSIHIFLLLISLFIMAPVLIVAVVSFQDKAYLAFPIEHYSLRWWNEALFRPEWRNAIWTSLTLAIEATVVSTLIGISAGLVLHYHDFRGKQVLRLFFLAPLLMPQLLIGLALLFYFAQMQISGTYGTLLLGHILVTFPYVVQVILAALPSVSRTLEEASMTLGANEVKTLLKVTLH